MVTRHFSVVLIVSALILSLPLLIAGCTRPDPAGQYKSLVHKYLHAWNSGNVSSLETIVSNQFEMRVSPSFDARRSLDSLKSSIVYWHTAYPDFHIEFNEVIYSPNAVAIRWTLRGTNSGPGPPPPTGKAVNFPGMSILHISEGKIDDEWISGDDLTWFKQLGFTLVAATPGK
jgi:steroid delta-isomerase-like uncharacterized protein